MSRIGKKSINIPENVSVIYQNNVLTVIGPFGILRETFNFDNIKIIILNKVICVNCTTKDKKDRALFGLVRSIIYNMVYGVSFKFIKVVILNGIGYNAHVQDNNLLLNIGYSNVINIVIPVDITVFCETLNKIKISGINKQKVGAFAAIIKNKRPVEPYKGIGIYYEHETIVLKGSKQNKTKLKNK